MKKAAMNPAKVNGSTLNETTSISAEERDTPTPPGTTTVDEDVNANTNGSKVIRRSRRTNSVGRAVDITVNEQKQRSQQPDRP